ncbi:MAG TPA: ATP-binding protein [Dehalococcoidia bacterium]|nr:ATP-binding protein [Dehalococcoidia bacterium]
MNDHNLDERTRLGAIVSGSLTRGVEVKLDASVSVEDMAVGRYVAIEGEKRRFFGMITDVSLEAIDSRVTITPPDISDPFIAQVVAGTTTYGKLRVLPMLTIGSDAVSILEGPQPAKTVPTHFSEVKLASQRDVELVFGAEDDKRFYVGTPLDMETKVCLDVSEFVKRSNGVFGKSGTGKTFLTCLLLIGILQKRAAVSLVFDMHSEYGWEGRNEKGYKVKGLKQLFPSKVAVFTLDEESSRWRKVSTDFVVKIGYDEIEPEDIELLRQTLNLTEASTQAVYQLAREFGDRKWLEAVLNLSEDNGKQLISKLNIHDSTYRNLRRGLETLRRFPFLVPHASDNSVQRILEYLERGINVVLEFGRFDDFAAYILVANLLSRRIYAQYREKAEKAGGADMALPHPLVITIEEAHRFLNPELSAQTIFGRIAREMRKYNVTLLVIDQRPSGIDDEVMSQLGTKITCLLDNERDVDSVFTGVTGKSELKSVLSKLETKQQALIFGHAVPMPVVIKTREYGSAESYKELGFLEAAELKRKAEKEIEDLWAT